MTDQLPAPLVPASVDLRDFAFMPLDVLRLRDSDISVEATGEEFRAAVLLWCAAWHQVPAGSLPDNDARLGQFAGYGRVTSAWLEVKAGALRGFVKCSDGRLYHPVIAEKALESWEKKQAHAERKEADRQRKAKRDEERSVNSSGETGNAAKNSGGTTTEFRWNDNGIPAENALKGQGQGQGIITAAADAGARPVELCSPPDAPPPPPPIRPAKPSTADPEALDVVRALDDAIGAAFGEDRRRPYPDAIDRVIARRWIDAGADLPLIADVLNAVCRRASQAQRAPPKSLKYFDQAVADALAARNAPPKKPSPQGGDHARRSTPFGAGETTRGHVDDDARRCGILEACGFAGDLGAG
jgi:hypothetical protein